MVYNKKMNKKYFKREYLFLFLAILVSAAGFWGYDFYEKKKWEREDVIDTFEENIPLQCENGNWIEFPDLENQEQYEKFSGNEKLKYDEKNDVFLGSGNSNTFSVNSDYSLTFFMDRDVRIEGYKLPDNQIYVKKIKCVGVEANQDVLKARRNLMNYISSNINSLALEKASKNDWQVETFYFVNDADLYVQYESEGSFLEETPYDSRLWLVRVKDMSRPVPMIETLAYIQEDADDPEKNVTKQGNDPYKDAKNLTAYEFDEDANQWVLQ